MYRGFLSMTIYLSKDMEQIVHDAVRSGLYAREDDVIRDAQFRLKDEIPKGGRTPRRKARSGRAAKDKQLTDALNERLLAAGLITRLPDPAEDIDDNDP